MGDGKHEWCRFVVDRALIDEDLAARWVIDGNQPQRINVGGSTGVVGDL